MLPKNKARHDTAPNSEPLGFPEYQMPDSWTLTVQAKNKQQDTVGTYLFTVEQAS